MFFRGTIGFLWTGLLYGGSVFITSHLFVNQEITAKLYFAEIAALVGCVFMSVVASWGRSRIGLSRTDFLVSACLLYVCIRTMVSGMSDLSVVMPFICFSFLFLGWHQLPVELRNTRNVGCVFGVIALAEVLYGLWPLIHYVQGVGEFPVLRGSFDNPAGFAACMVCFFPWCIHSVFSSGKVLRVLWIIVVLFVVVGVIVSGSRVGMLCVFMVSLGTLFQKTPNTKWWSVPKKVAVVFLALVLLSGFLYFFKVDSAQGRLLIWRCSTGLINDHLLLGAGPHGFQAHYMLYQAEYFKANPDSSFLMLADNVRHPFNEFVALVSEYGILGLLLLGLLGGSVFLAYRVRYSEEKFTALLCLMSILVLSCFSYPFRYSFVWILAAWSVSLLVTGEEQIMIVSGWSRRALVSAFGVLSLLFVLFCVHRMKAEIHWNVVAHQSLLGKTEEMLPEYERLGNVLGNDPHFLYNYGAELYQVGRFDRSLTMARKCSKGLNDLDVQMLLAMDYVALGRVDSAEYSFVLASQMCPNRFAPLIGLMRLYASSNRMDDAKKVARSILSKEVKVPSDRVLILIDEARRFLGK